MPNPMAICVLPVQSSGLPRQMDRACQAIRLLLEHTHNLAEGAGAVSLAAALAHKERLAGKNVVLVMSGGNLAADKLRNILCGVFG